MERSHTKKDIEYEKLTEKYYDKHRELVMLQASVKDIQEILIENCEKVKNMEEERGKYVGRIKEMEEERENEREKVKMMEENLAYFLDVNTKLKNVITVPDKQEDEKVLARELKELIATEMNSIRQQQQQQQQQLQQQLLQQQQQGRGGGPGSKFSFLSLSDMF